MTLLLPRSLLWRTVLVLALLLVVSQIVLFQLFRISDRVPRARHLAEQVASVVNLSRAALLSAQPAERQALLEALSQREGIRVHADAPAEAPDRPPLAERPFLPLLRVEVSRLIGEPTRIEFRGRPVPALWVAFRVADQPYWVSIPRARIVERPFPWHWVAWVGIVFALSLIGATLIISRINRPLRTLAEAATQIGHREPVAPLPERGPSEIRALARAFNDMAADLSRLDADRALLLAGVSHDLRTPLARLRLGLELLGAGDAKLQADMVQDIEDMDAAIGQFLDFARDENAEPATAGADLNAIVRRAAGRRMPPGHVPPRLELAPVPGLPLRPLAIERLIANLLDNAVRHGGGEVTIETRAAGDEVILSVLDRGPGIPPGESARLLKPFTRLDLARGTPGAGLGLAIVDRVARGHGGRALLLQRAGGGTEARVTLPIPSS
jgi:two-component system, OmpR family, osmolarity sensor histidine kinase EnvZ